MSVTALLSFRLETFPHVLSLSSCRVEVRTRLHATMPFRLGTDLHLTARVSSRAKTTLHVSTTTPARVSMSAPSSAVKPLGICLRTADGTDMPVKTFTYSNGVNVGCKWSANFAAVQDIDFPDDDEFRLVIALDGDEWVSPPLVAPVRNNQEGVGIGGAGDWSGVDATTYRLSQDGLDKPTYTRQYSDDIIGDLAGPEVTVVGAPHYLIAEYDAHAGRPLEHIARILHDGGYSFRIGVNGELACFPIQGNGAATVSPNSIKTLSERRDGTKRNTFITITKTSKVQAHYEYTWEDTGNKTISFASPLKDIMCRDLSIVGYVDLIAAWDAANINTAGLVKLIIMNTETAEGLNLPTPTSDGPIVGLSLQVFPPRVAFEGQTISAKLVIEAIPDGDWSGLDVSFVTTYDSEETPARPLRSPVDGILMPTLAHAEGIKEALLWDGNKGAHTITATSDDPLPWTEPYELLQYPGKPDARIETVSMAGSTRGIGTTLEAAVIDW